MPKRQDWSRAEVEACVADYLRMLVLELNGQRYNKTEHANLLLKKLDGRSRPSLEFKHCNISAVMIELGYPYITGYKPRGNYQALLADVVEAHLGASPAVQEAAQWAVLRPAVEAATLDADSVEVPAPTTPFRPRETPPKYGPRFLASKRDFLAQEARNRSLGRAGELFVIELEARRLHAAGQKRLGDRVEHVAATQGDGLGYDVLSFEVTGQERLIEVKTTAFGKLTPFFVSSNELSRSHEDSDRYHLYRLFEFRDMPRLFKLLGSIAGSCTLEPVSYLARVAG